jgi:hypothetical protein
VSNFKQLPTKVYKFTILGNSSTDFSLHQIGFLRERRVVKGNIVLKDESIIVFGGNSNCNVECFTVENNKLTNVNIGESFK